MIVNSLQVENVVTFGTFDLCFADASLVVARPNGAGKSNIVRGVDLVQKAADSVSGQPAGLRGQAADQVRQSFAAAPHHGEPAGRDAEVRLGVSTTECAHVLAEPDGSVLGNTDEVVVEVGQGLVAVGEDVVAGEAR